MTNNRSSVATAFSARFRKVNEYIDIGSDPRRRRVLFRPVRNERCCVGFPIGDYIELQ